MGRLELINKFQCFINKIENDEWMQEVIKNEYIGASALINTIKLCNVWIGFLLDPDYDINLIPNKIQIENALDNYTNLIKSFKRKETNNE